MTDVEPAAKERRLDSSANPFAGSVGSLVEEGYYVAACPYPPEKSRHLLSVVASGRI